MSEVIKIIALGCDHGGFDLKNIFIDYLRKNSLEYKDFGVEEKRSCDYPDYAKLVCESIIKNESEKGILICSTGIGMSICANRFKEIRAALCNNSFVAKMSREHNNANVLVIGEKITGVDVALDILKIFLETRFSEEDRHIKRINKLS